METTEKPLRVVVRLGWRYRASREFARGVLRYAATHPRLQLAFAGLHDGSGMQDDYRRWRPDGVIGNAKALVKELQGAVAAESPAAATLAGALRAIRRSCPTCRAVVFLHDGPAGGRAVRAGPASAVVRCDHRAVARAAARLFLRRGLRHFGYVGSRVPERHYGYDERGAHLADAACEAGATFSAYEPVAGERDWNAEEKRLAAWLAALPKPCGVMAAFDARAKQVLDACRAAGVGVPSQVQVCGVDNEDWLCDQTLPTLTSVEPDFERGGYVAASALDAMLGGEGRPEAAPGQGEALSYGVRGVVERLSTRDEKGSSRIVLAAQEFIRLHAASPVSVADVAKAVGCSRRLLQIAFRAVLGTTPVRALQDARLARALDLLDRTSTPISEIAPLCGVESESHLKVLFRRRFGCTMGEWRARNRAARGP